MAFDRRKTTAKPSKKRITSSSTARQPENIKRRQVSVSKPVVGEGKTQKRKRK